MSNPSWSQMVQELYEGLDTDYLAKESSELFYQIRNEFNSADSLKKAGEFELADQHRSLAFALTKRSKRINMILATRNYVRK